MTAIGVISVLLMLSVSVGSVESVNAAPRVRITRIFFDSPGSDSSPTNTKLNAEYISLRNVTSLPVLMTGWKVSDAQGHNFSFPSGFTLAANTTVKVHTGVGINSATHLYFGSGYFIWNNTGDTGTLKNAAGTTASSCKYPNVAGGVAIYGTDLTGRYAQCY